ncbi:CBS domain-containing protein [Salinimonas sp. HHU 13199]|uniref:CBS domain-containing protein n=1 Tax=Salinimonas profundi TaxID=2729140 RepID=A0ABR8LKW0_9ALTE|nr:CBS domain-containing protein [Salinimonas profundi]MBD3585581.1 CBS domain-containing protein [Salinimonas profundi]
MHTLSLFKTEPSDTLAWPHANDQISPNSPARDVMADFAEHAPYRLSAATPAVSLLPLLKQSHVNAALVTDSNERFCGLITRDDVSEARLLQIVAEGTRREDIVAADCMQPRNTLHSVAFEEIQRAKVKDVLETLRASGQQHCLVTDQKNHEIRGLICARDIAELLNLKVDIAKPATFAELSRILAA